MRKLTQTLLAICAGLLFGAQATLLTGCNDDLAADSYYTFTGEMMSDYLDRPDFSLFKRIVERAGEMSFLATRGSRTLFPATNEGVEAFLKEFGYASVEDIPESYCDTLVKAALVERVLYTYNLMTTHQESNQLDLPLIIVSEGDSLDENGMALSIINRRAAIINELKNDSVENGVVHPVDRVLVPNTSLGASLLEDNHEEFSIYYEALRRTGLLDSLSRYRDDDYEVWKNNYEPYSQSMQIGNEMYMGKRPDHRYTGFTLFIVPDEVLYEKYSDRFNEGMTMDEKIDALYELAEERYDDVTSAAIFGLDKTDPATGLTYKQAYWNKESLTSRHNPLNMFLSYHILDRLFTSTAKLINCWQINTQLADPTEWINTMLDYTTIKLERVYTTIDPEVPTSGEYYINHSEANAYTNYERIPGSRLSVPDAENFSLNVAYYYVDDVLAYDETMRTKVMNTRMRIDFLTLCPEFTTNNIRLCGNPTQGYNSGDNSEEGTEGGGHNWYIPKGYLKNVEFSDNTIFFIERPIIAWSNMGGDVLAILGTSYDITFRLPSVPPGTYELRLGYTALAARGIGQVYVDDVPQGLPMDMRIFGNDARIGGLYNGWAGWRNKDENASGIYTTEELEENERIMNNNGYYSAPKSVFFNNDGTDAPRYSPSNCTMYYNSCNLLRRKICNVEVEPNRYHTIRMRSVLTSSTISDFTLDFMELVPIDICGAGGLGEDMN